MEQLLEVCNLKKYFPTPKGMLHAVDDVSFTLTKKQTLGVVGESGCGKSTLGRTILGLTQATEGQIYFHGKDITNASGKERKRLRSEMQIIFQDPFSSLDPRKNVVNLIAEPLQINRVYRKKADLLAKVEELMDVVGLAKRFADSYPHELDGGRRQRIGVARALAMDPEFIVCDEPVSALDVSVQAQILNLLQDLQAQKQLTYMFITHDLSVVKHISDEIIVMYLGCIVEKAPTRDLFQNPLHPYTQGLLSAIPIPSLRNKKEKILLQGELTSPINPKPGCRFAVRCPHAKECCRCETPALKDTGNGHYVACHFIGGPK